MRWGRNGEVRPAGENGRNLVLFTPELSFILQNYVRVFRSVFCSFLQLASRFFPHTPYTAKHHDEDGASDETTIQTAHFSLFGWARL